MTGSVIRTGKAYNSLFQIEGNLAQRIFYSDLKNKKYDHVLIAMGAVEYDARMLNMAFTLQKKCSNILLVGLYTPKWHISCENLDVDVLMMENYTLSPMFKLWFGYYRWLYSFRNMMKSDTFWAMDLYVLPYVTWLSRKNRSGSLYDSREVYSALGTAGDHPVKQKIIALIERKYISKADKIFTSGPLDSKYLAKIYNIPVPDVIMNLPKFEIPAKSNLLRERYHIPENQKILLYQGGIRPGRGLGQALEVILNVPELVLCIIGSGEKVKKQLINTAGRIGVGDRIFFQDPVPYKELLKWTSSADIGWCFIESLTLSLEYALPNKLFEYAMAGIPSVISDLPQMTPYLKKYECGIILPGDADSIQISTTIKTALDSPGFERMKENTKNMARDMNWESQANKIFQMASLT